MNLKNIKIILDAKYERVYCKGLGSMGEKKKQLIPTFRDADRLVRLSDPGYYKSALQNNFRHKHYTGVYYCPWCDGWHITTIPGGASRLLNKTKQEISKAKLAGEPMTHLPSENHLTKDYNFKDYTEEELSEFFKRFQRNESKEN